MKATVCTSTYFSHDCYGSLSFSLSHPVLYQVVHILVIQQADQVKGTKTCSTAQSQVPDYHGTNEKEENKWKMFL